ncbi:MAG: hypothetical protein NTZ33_01550 [Bacteroidetes bacterium]|nr:hypothetical protein [Bacteroidota bacterium]
MKKILTLAIIIGFVFTFSNCKKDDSTTTTTPSKPSSTGISVTITKLASETGVVPCNGLSVELHSNSTYTEKKYSTTSAGNTALGTASFANVPNGKYYLIAWKDLDASGSKTVGDYFGFLETPAILDGTSKAYSLQMYILK